jgi:hypothetical protein
LSGELCTQSGTEDESDEERLGKNLGMNQKAAGPLASEATGTKACHLPWRTEGVSGDHNIMESVTQAQMKPQSLSTGWGRQCL